MGIGKTDNGVLVQAALMGLLPLLSEQIKDSPQYQKILGKIAAAEQGAIAAHDEAMRIINEQHQRGLRLYAEIREDVGELLSGAGLQFVVDDYKALTSPAPAPVPPAPVQPAPTATDPTALQPTTVSGQGG
ncbi:MAG: hypothetical protein IE925_10070 [Rhodobacterales bacterium]|nr:hypothetical protein [Rhodobacterales bacterium]